MIKLENLHLGPIEPVIRGMRNPMNSWDKSDSYVNYSVEFEDDSEYTWDVISSARRNIPLVEARNETGEVVAEGDENVGAGTAPFELVFAEDWFADGRIFAVI